MIELYKLSQDGPNFWQRRYVIALIKTGIPEKTFDLGETLESAFANSKVSLPNPSIYVSNSALCYTRGSAMLHYETIDDWAARSEFYTTIGKAFEEVVEKAFTKKGIKFRREVPISLKLETSRISGRMDFVFKNPANDQTEILELKSCGKLPEKPQPDHLAQLKAYLALTGVKVGWLWYISRSVSDFSGYVTQKSFKVELSDVDRSDALYTLFIASQSKKFGAIPSRPEKMRKTHCKFCPFFDRCWAGDFIDSLDKEIFEAAQLELNSFLAVYESNSKEILMRGFK